MMNLAKNHLKAALAMAIALSLCSLSACVPKPVEETVTEWGGKEELEIPENDPSIEERYADLSQKASLAFKSSSATDISDFETEEVDGGIKIVKYTGSGNIVVIPERAAGGNVLAIGANAFADTTVSAIYIPDSVTVIEKGALEGASHISTLRIPFLGDGAEITHFGYIFNCDSYETQATRVPASLDMVIVGKCASVSDNAFASCKSVSAIVLPDEVTSIGNFAFYECADLVYIKTGSNLKNVGKYAFGYCSSLYSLELTKVESIGLGALYEASSLYSITVPFVGGSASENRYIGYIFGADSADYNDEFVSQSLRCVTVSGNTDIPDRAFASCAYITDITFSEGITTIGVRAFYSCRSISSVALPNSLKSIKDDAFFACESMKSISFGTGLESIGMQAFFGCSALDNVKMPEKVTELKSSVFALCTSLKNVDLNNVTVIGKDAFLNCPYSPN